VTSKKEKAALIQSILEILYPDPQIPLYHKSAYTLLIAVLLSASATDKKVNEITPKLFSLADTPERMIQLSQEEIEEIIRPIGLSKAKSKAIYHLSQDLVTLYNGQVPDTYEKLEKLPGVGHKTASVVMAQVFQKPAFPIDTHIFRLAKRWGLSKGKTVETVEKDLKSLFPKEKWIRLHLQIIFFGREHCKARGHLKQTCPICHLM
jgi:endonuclease-3